MDRGACWVTVHGIAESDITEWLTLLLLLLTMSSFNPVFLQPQAWERNAAESFPSIAGEFTSYLGSCETGIGSDVKIEWTSLLKLPQSYVFFLDLPFQLCLLLFLRILFFALAGTRLWKEAEQLRPYYLPEQEQVWCNCMNLGHAFKLSSSSLAPVPVGAHLRVRSDTISVSIMEIL